MTSSGHDIGVPCNENQSPDEAEPMDRNEPCKAAKHEEEVEVIAFGHAVEIRDRHDESRDDEEERHGHVDRIKAPGTAQAIIILVVHAVRAHTTTFWVFPRALGGSLAEDARDGRCWPYSI